MPLEFCEICSRPLNGIRRELEICRFCESRKNKEIEDVSEFVENQPDIKYEDGLTYIIEKEPEFDD
jgi:hypothetical protein